MPTFDGSPSPSATKPPNRKFLNISDMLLLSKTKFGQTLQDSVRSRHTKIGAVRPLGGAVISKIAFLLISLEVCGFKSRFSVC